MTRLWIKDSLRDERVFHTFVDEDGGKERVCFHDSDYKSTLNCERCCECTDELEDTLEEFQ